MIIRYNGELKNAQILMRSGDILRIALESAEDAVELSLLDGIWLSEENLPVSFEFLTATEIPLLHPEIGPHLAAEGTRAYWATTV